ncbi:MAG: PAS domain S-box protein [Chthoniobacter sp.]|uniref:PAS domain S-box protein n=1 Tax=Chthoniobacter sp. TaxID=2510640 RepID=UPI0032AA3FE0
MNRTGQVLQALLVEDSDADAELLVAALRQGGFAPNWLRVENEQGLRAALRAREWDIVFCDYSLPSFDAPNAIRVLRECGCDAPIIIVSGAVGEDLAVESLRHGASDYLPKNNLRRLVPAVQRELRDSASRRLQQLSEAKKHFAEEALRASEERYRVLFECNPIPMWVYDRAGWRFLQVNEAAIAHYGYSREEFLALSVLDLRPLEDVSQLLRTIGDRRNDAPLTRGTWRHRKKDGSIIFVEVVTQPIKYGGQKARIAQALDITEHKVAEEELTRIKMAVDFAADAIAIMDESGSSVYHNRVFEELLGCTPAQLNAAGGVRSLFVHQQVADEVLTNVSQTGSWAGDAYLTCNGSRPIQLFLRANTARDADGKLITTSIVCTDLRDQKRAQGKIEEQAALLDHAQDAIIVHDLSGRINYWNKSARRVFGWTTAEVTGRRVQDILYESAESFDDAMGQLLREGTWTGELHQRNRDDKQVLVEGRWTLVRDEFGDPKSVLSINTDITEKKKLESQFLRAQRMESIGTLAGGIAHDLNNVLGPIIMAVDLFKLKMTDPGDLELLDTVAVSARRGADMVRQVLSFARGLEGQRTLIRPLQLMKEIQRIARDTFPKDITVHVSAPDDTWSLLGDPTQLHQVLLNLCVNARDAMAQGGRLNLSAANFRIDAQFAGMHPDAQPGAFVVLEISDTGTGMSPDVLEKIFEPFFTTKEIGKGTGLGLSTTLAIVRSHNGFVTVESIPGRGTKFRVHLPAELDDAEAHPGERQGEFPRGEGEYILIIDDEASVRSITSQTLEAFGYRVVTAVDGAEGVAKYAQHMKEIAAVVTDMMMPVMDGAATIRALSRLNPEVKIIAASGLATKGAEAEAAGAGTKIFLPKPYTASSLLVALRDLLRPAT